MTRRGNQLATTPAPGMAEAFQEIRGDYAAAKASRFRRTRTGVSPVGSGADYHYRSDGDFLRLLEYARDMARNDCIVGQMVDKAVNNIVGENGPVVDPLIEDEGLRGALYDRFSAWAADKGACDAQGEQTFVGLCEMVVRQTFVDGGVFVLPLEDGSLQVVEGHRCRTPDNSKRKDTILGVTLDPVTRRRKIYWFTREEVDPSQTVKTADLTSYPAYDAGGEPLVLHVYDPKRATQTRGVTFLAPVFDLTGMFEDLNFAKVVQAQVASCIAFIRERNPDWKPNAGLAGVYGAQTAETLSGGAKRLVENIAPGMEVTGDPGETVKAFSPNVPNAEFFTHVQLLLTLIGNNLGVPLVMLTMDASQTNFSGWRGAIDQARQGFRRNRRWIRDRFLSEVYRWQVRRAIAEDKGLRAAAERLGPRIFDHRWNFARWPYIQPLQDAQANALILERRLTSPRRLHDELSQDYDEVMAETVADNGAAIEAAIERRNVILAKFPGERIDWRELLYLPAGAAPLQIAANPTASEPPPPADTVNDGEDQPGTTP